VLNKTIAMCCMLATTTAADWFTAPAGTGEACTREAPCALATTLCDPAPCRYAVQPGDTIWLAGGTYTGAPFVSTLTGTADAPIVVRQAPGARATIDGNYAGNDPTLTIKGANTWYWGFEIFNSDPTRYTADGENPPRRGEGVLLLGKGARLVNMVIHDTSQAVLTSEVAVGAKVYGSLLYYNGFLSPDRGHGHGIYAQNFDATPKELHDNIIFEQFGWGIHAYGEGGHLDNMDLEGNVSFDNGGLAGTYRANILVGGTANVAHRPRLVANYTYTRNGKGKNDLGYSAGCTDPVVMDNYFANGRALDVNNCTGLAIDGNTFVGTTAGFSASAFANNTYLGTARPSVNQVFVRGNAYEPKRANIVVYNWELGDTVDVDVGGVLAVGDGYEVRNAADFFAAPVAEGTYTGAAISLPLRGLSVASPIGVDAPAPTGPELGVFVLLPRDGAPGGDSPAGDGVDPPGGGCGCGVSATPGWLWLVVAWLLVRRRRATG